MSSHVYNDKYMQNRAGKNIRNTRSHVNQRSYSQNNPNQKRHAGEAMKRLTKYDRVENQRDSSYQGNTDQAIRGGNRGGTRGHKTSQHYSPGKNRKYRDEHDFMYDLNLKTEKQMKISNLKHVPIEVNLLQSINDTSTKVSKPVSQQTNQRKNAKQNYQNETDQLLYQPIKPSTGNQTMDAIEQAKQKVQQEIVRSPRSKKAAEGASGSIERTVNYKEKQGDKDFNQLPDIISDGFKIIKDSGKCTLNTENKTLYRKQCYQKRQRYKLLENQIRNDTQSDNVTSIRNSKVPNLDESQSPARFDGNNMSEADNLFSLATSSMNSKTFKGHMKQPQAIKQARILASNESVNLSNINKQNVQTQYQDQNQDQYAQQSIDQSNNTQNLRPNAQQEVQYSKKSTIKRFLTLKDKQNHVTTTSQGAHNKDENNSTNVQNNEKISSKQAIKRVMTQKGDGKRGRGGHGNEPESSDNGITLCKISESGLEELSIVQSDALYESENQNPNDVQEIYNQRILQKMNKPGLDGQEREIYRRSSTNKQSQKGRSYKTPEKIGNPSQFKNNKYVDRSSSPRLFAQRNQVNRQGGNDGRVKSILKNQDNIKAKDVHRKYQDNQFSVGNSSEYFMGYSESQFSRHYRRSKEQVEKSLNRNTSNILSSQDGGSSFNISIEKRSNASYMASQKKYQKQNHQAIRQMKQNIMAQKKYEQSSHHSSSQGKIGNSNLTSVKHDQSSNDSESPLRIPLFKNQIPKIPGLKRKNRQDKNSKQRGFSKELDQVVEKEELDYSPMKSGSQIEAANFEMGCKLNNEREKKLDAEIMNGQKNIETIKEELITTDSNNVEDSIFYKESLRRKFNNQQAQNNGGVQVAQVNSKLNSQMERDYYKNKINLHAKRSHVKIQNEEKQQKDSNHDNLKNQNMFIPNQQNVSQVKGKSKFYLQDKRVSQQRKDKQRNPSPSRNKNISQVSGNKKTNQGREQNTRFSMDSYGKGQQYQNDSNNNSLESRDSPSIEKDQKVAIKNQAKLMNQQNMMVSESQASLRLSQDTGGKDQISGYNHGQQSKFSKNSRYDGSPNKDQQQAKQYGSGIRKQNTHTDKKSYKDLSSEQNNDGQVIGIETRRSRRSRRSEFERNTKSSQDHSRKLRKSMKEFFNTNESSHNVQDKSNISPARTSQNTKFDSRKGTAQGTQKYHGYLQSYRINKNHEVLIKDQSGGDLQDNQPLLAINKSPCQGPIRQKNEVMYQQIKNIYLPTSKLKQQITNLYSVNKQGSAPTQNPGMNQNPSQTAMQQIAVNIVSTNRDLALLQYKQNAKVMQNKMKYLNQGNYSKAQAQGALFKQEGSRDAIPSIDNLPMMNSSINSNQRKIQLNKSGGQQQYTAYKDNYQRGLSFQDNRKSTKYPEIVMGTRKNNQANFSGKKDTASRQGGGWLQKLKQVKPVPIQLQTMPYLKGNTLNNRENQEFPHQQNEQIMGPNETTQDNFIFIQSPRRQTEMEIVSNSKNSDQTGNYKFSKSVAGNKNTQGCFQQRHGSSIPLSQANNAPMDTRNLKSQNKARIAVLETRIDESMPPNKMTTTLSNKQQREKSMINQNQNENSTHLLLEQSNSLIDVKSANYQQKYAQIENQAAFYNQYNENPSANGDNKFFQKRKMENQTCMAGWNKKSQYSSPERGTKKIHKSVQKSGQKPMNQATNNIHFPSPGQGSAINEIYQRKMDSNNMNYKKYMRANGTQQNFTNFKQNQNLNSIEKKDSFYKQQVQYNQ